MMVIIEPLFTSIGDAILAWHVQSAYRELMAWALLWLRQIRELYRLNRERLRHVSGTPKFTAADAKLRQHVAAMATQRDAKLAGDKLREPCRKVLVNLNEHWGGLTLFVDDPRIPMCPSGKRV